MDNIMEADRFRKLYEESAAMLSETDYMQKRGISPQICERFNVGFCPNWVHPHSKGKAASPRIIIPYSDQNYFGHDTREAIPDAQKKYEKQRITADGIDHACWIFNSSALWAAKKPIIIVEGEIDCMSIVEVGGEAVSIGGTSGVNEFINLISNRKPVQPLVIALDNDMAGQAAANKLADALRQMNIPFYKFNPYGEYKDANETLVRDRQLLQKNTELASDYDRLCNSEDARRLEEYMKKSAASRFESFIRKIKSGEGFEAVPTGFDTLDSILDGGLFPGLYVLNAGSSIGKTTFSMQICDQIAQSGRDVIVFSLEMSEEELMAKSVSRISCSTELRERGAKKYALTARELLKAKTYNNSTEEALKLIDDSIREYLSYAHHIYITDKRKISTDEIRDVVEEHIRITGNKPVVIVDYLQLVAFTSNKDTDKANVDNIVSALVDISKGNGIPVLAISSINRHSYNQQIGMDSAKESGSVEFSADVMFGLQLEGVGEKNFDEKAARKSVPRRLELVILKSRLGNVGEVIKLTSYAAYNFFAEENTCQPVMAVKRGTR